MQRSEAQNWAAKIAEAERKQRQQDKAVITEEQAQAQMARTTLANLISDSKPKSK